MGRNHRRGNTGLPVAQSLGDLIPHGWLSVGFLVIGLMPVKVYAPAYGHAMQKIFNRG